MRYFEPWIGNNFASTRTLLLSESTYNWLDENEQIATPQPTHPEGSIKWNIENFGKNRYFTQVNRALCMKQRPSSAEMQGAWDDYAYTIFVQESVGFGAGVRPTKAHWHGAGPDFLSLLEELRPTKVIVTGADMWATMPECSLRLLDDLQAYKLSDGHFGLVLGSSSPSQSHVGFQMGSHRGEYPTIQGDSVSCNG